MSLSNVCQIYAIDLKRKIDESCDVATFLMLFTILPSFLGFQIDELKSTEAQWKDSPHAARNKQMLAKWKNLHKVS